MRATPETLLAGGSLRAIGAALRDRQFSAVELVGWYLRRIDARNGILHAVRELAADALDQAGRADAALAAGSDAGPLHGMPILLKDNVLTADGMAAAAGVVALNSFRPRHEATLVRRLRASGAIILGKTNMTELADYVAETMPAGFSGAGGMVHNPHGSAYGRGQGSSVGSAAAVAAGFVPIAIGSETQNSIQAPACHSSIVGYKPSVGAVSRDGIVPLVPSQDSPGVLARTVDDAALVMAAIAGADIADTATLGLRLAPARFANRPQIARIRLGVPRAAIADRPEFAALLPLFETALRSLARQGALLVDPCEIPGAGAIAELRSCVFRTEFKAAFNGFLRQHDGPCGIDSLATLIAWNRDHPEAIPYGQSLLEGAEAAGDLDGAAYRNDRNRDLELSLDQGLRPAMVDVDALIVPMAAAAKLTGKAGAPVVAIPIGPDGTGAPVGITLIGLPGEDWNLLAIAASVEAAIGNRLIPEATALRRDSST